MEAVAYTVTAIVLYLGADALLDAAEQRAGHRYPQRSLIFFVILLTLSLVTFALLRHVFD